MTAQHLGWVRLVRPDLPSKPMAPWRRCATSSRRPARMIVMLMAVGLLGWACGPAAAADLIDGQVQIVGNPVAQSAVTLWAASANAPRRLAQAQTGTDGRFTVRAEQSAGRDAILYLVAAGGVPAINKAGGNNPAIVSGGAGQQAATQGRHQRAYDCCLGVYHRTFYHGDAISGNQLGLQIAAGNVPNLVDPSTGTWGKVLLDPLNSTQTATLATLDTLGSLITAYATTADDTWRGSFLKRDSIGATRSKNDEAWLDRARRRGATPKGCSHSSIRRILNPRTARAARRRSCRILPGRRPTSR